MQTTKGVHQLTSGLRKEGRGSPVWGTEGTQVGEEFRIASAEWIVGRGAGCGGVCHPRENGYATTLGGRRLRKRRGTT